MKHCFVQMFRDRWTGASSDFVNYCRSRLWLSTVVVDCRYPSLADASSILGRFVLAIAFLCVVCFSSRRVVCVFEGL